MANGNPRPRTLATVLTSYSSHELVSFLYDRYVLLHPLMFMLQSTPSYLNQPFHSQARETSDASELISPFGLACFHANKGGFGTKEGIHGPLIASR